VPRALAASSWRAARRPRPVDEGLLLGLAFEQRDELLALDRLATKQNLSQLFQLVAMLA
jgi:hypothetical protein